MFQRLTLHNERSNRLSPRRYLPEVCWRSLRQTTPNSGVVFLAMTGVLVACEMSGAMRHAEFAMTGGASPYLSQVLATLIWLMARCI